MTNLATRPADEAPLPRRESRPDTPAKLDTVTPRDGSL